VINIFLHLAGCEALKIPIIRGEDDRHTFCDSLVMNQLPFSTGNVCLCLQGTSLAFPSKGVPSSSCPLQFHLSSSQKDIPSRYQLCQISEIC
jgi:hypothetical protein